MLENQAHWMSGPQSAFNCVWSSTDEVCFPDGKVCMYIKQSCVVRWSLFVVCEELQCGADVDRPSEDSEGRCLGTPVPSHCRQGCTRPWWYQKVNKTRDAPIDKALADYRPTDNRSLTIGRLPINA